MGGWSWSRHYPGPDLTTVVNDAIAQDRDTYGSDPYTGSIGQATGASQATIQVCHRLEAAYLAQSLCGGTALSPHCDYSDLEARSAAEAIGKRRAKKLRERLGPDPYRSRGYDSYDVRRDLALHSLPIAAKWENVYAIPTGDDDAFKLSQHKVNVNAVEVGLHGAGIHEAALIEHVHDVFAAKSGTIPRIANVELVEDKPKYRTKVASTEGAIVTRYRLYRRDRHGRLDPLREDPQPSMPAARARITEILKTNTASTPPSHNHGEVEYVVLGERVREDGSPLLVGTRELIGRTATYTVTLVTPKTSSPAVTGWQVYGVAGS